MRNFARAVLIVMVVLVVVPAVVAGEDGGNGILKVHVEYHNRVPLLFSRGEPEMWSVVSKAAQCALNALSAQIYDLDGTRVMGYASPKSEPLRIPLGGRSPAEIAQRVVNRTTWELGAITLYVLPDIMKNSSGSFRREFAIDGEGVILLSLFQDSKGTPIPEGELCNLVLHGLGHNFGGLHELSYGREIESGGYVWTIMGTVGPQSESRFSEENFDRVAANLKAYVF